MHRHSRTPIKHIQWQLLASLGQESTADKGHTPEDVISSPSTTAVAESSTEGNLLDFISGPECSKDERSRSQGASDENSLHGVEEMDLLDFRCDNGQRNGHHDVAPVRPKSQHLGDTFDLLCATPAGDVGINVPALVASNAVALSNTSTPQFLGEIAELSSYEQANEDPLKIADLWNQSRRSNSDSDHGQQPGSKPELALIQDLYHCQPLSPNQRFEESLGHIRSRNYHSGMSSREDVTVDLERNIPRSKMSSSISSVYGDQREMTTRLSQQRVMEPHDKLKRALPGAPSIRNAGSQASTCLSNNEFRPQSGGCAWNSNCMPSDEFSGGRFYRPRHSNPSEHASGETVPTAIPVRLIEEYYKASPTGHLNWLRLPEIPTAYEVGSIVDGRVEEDPTIELESNRLEGPWQSIEHYLTTHYELIREDAVAPLREALEEFRAKPELMEKDSEEHVRIYDQVYITGLTLASQGIAVRVEFSTRRVEKRIRWPQSKRLKSGTLVALSPAEDMFRSVCIVAVVAARPLVQLESEIPNIDLYFGDVEDLEIDTQHEYVMVEASNGYFEAYRHTLKALQKMYYESFPLSEHVVDVQEEIPAPPYRREQPYVNLTPAFKEQMDELLNVDILEAWPSLDQTEAGGARQESIEGLKQSPLPSPTLDDSQLEALRRILTKRLAIVQGPPGTGKTHVSVIALRVLLANMSVDDPPIIVTAQTNHALDQLLRHIAAFQPDFVRVGGQTKDTDIIQPRTLYAVKERNPKARKGFDGRVQMAKKHENNMAKELRDLLSPLSQEEPISPSTFLSLGLLTAAQHDSLMSVESDWVGVSENGSNTPMGRWCDNMLRRHERKPATTAFNIEYECEDEEFEQLKEVELERGVVDDDELETLRGPRYNLERGFVGVVAINDNDTKVEGLLRKHKDMNNIPLVHRGSIYSYLQRKTKGIIRQKVRKIGRAALRCAHDLKVGKVEVDSIYLRSARVIGLTTTGLSKYRGLIASLQPKMVLIEEAAETQEAYVTAACVPSLEHLILVGDHQQLQAHCQHPAMEEYNLHISMFERFVVYNNIAFKQLTTQRRMLPEIRRIISPIYPSLKDHQSVSEREDIPGMGGVNSFFFTHDKEESTDETFSRQNEEEANLIVGFFEYLVLNGTPIKDITVLTFYNGQRKKILGKLRHRETLQGTKFNVATVDSYQGEENEVVLLSLVRNNSKGQIGFLSISNRVCVALSRARRGFYLFGNVHLLGMKPLWEDVIAVMRETEEDPLRLGKSLPIRCAKHNTTTQIYSSLDWEFIDGGCKLRCKEPLACGHVCARGCHPSPHEELSCREECRRLLECEHQCREQCYVRPCRCRPCEEAIKLRKQEGDNEAPPSFPDQESISIRPAPDATTAMPPERPAECADKSCTRQRGGSSPDGQPLPGNVEKYQAFAQGGHVEADARLRERHIQSMGAKMKATGKSRSREARQPAPGTGGSKEGTLIDFDGAEGAARETSPVRKIWKQTWEPETASTKAWGAADGRTEKRDKGASVNLLD